MPFFLSSFRSLWSTPGGSLFSRADLWRLIWPLLVEQLLQISVGMVDIVMVATLGEACVSGVSLVDQINILLTQLFAALAAGGAVVCSHYVGARDSARACSSARQMIYVAMALSLAIMLLGLAFHRPLLSSIFGRVEASVMDVCQSYFVITICGLPGIALYNAAAALFRAQGNSRISMRISMVCNVVNVVGNAICIYGLGMGAEGVAIPTVLSRLLGAAALFVLLRGVRTDGSEAGAVSIRGISALDYDWRIIRKILSVGVPSGVENSMFQVGKILVLSLISSFGTVAVAANAATNTIASFQVLPGISVGLAMLTVVGQCLGAGRPDEAVRYVRLLMFLAYAGIWVINVPLLFCIDDILAFYGLSDETCRLASFMTISHGLGAMFIWPLSFTLPNALRAAADARFTMLVSMSTVWVVRVGLSYLFAATGILGLMRLCGLPPHYAAWGTWLAMIIDWVVRSAFFVIRFRRGAWQAHKLI